ncbi:MAG: hypothetical protein KKB70_05440 [Proteobacteria bacterium]|nr:hypothetical protein [Pseudomonadota bacterium]MBU1610604.1 hypothetical protein [Pseudomonadota bacterium]
MTNLKSYFGLAVAILLFIVSAMLLMPESTKAEPYPRQDMEGLKEIWRQNPRIREDSYNYIIHNNRTDQYVPNERVNLSTLEPTPGGMVKSLRYHTIRKMKEATFHPYPQHKLEYLQQFEPISDDILNSSVQSVLKGKDWRDRRDENIMDEGGYDYTDDESYRTDDQNQKYY